MTFIHAKQLLKMLPVALVAIALLAGCTLNPAVKEARDHADAGRREAALDVLDKASRENPGNLSYRSEYFRQRELAAAQWLAQAETLRQSGQFDAAASVYQRIQKYDPQNARAKTGLAELDAERRQRDVIVNAEKLIRDNKYSEARDILRPLLNENPTHRDARRLQREIDDKTLKPAVVTPQIKTMSSKPITIELREVTLRSVFDVIGQSTGLSFVFDKDIRSDVRTSIAVRNATPEELINLVLASNQLAQKLVNEATILVYPNTPQKQREYQELVIRTFYLANADVKQTANMIRTLVKTRDIFIDEKLNMLVIKDTPNAIRMAEKLVAAQDLADPEVMLEVEVLEVATNRVQELGMKFPDAIAWSLAGGAIPSPATVTTSTNPATGITTTTTTPGTGSTGAPTPGALSLLEWLTNPNRNLVRLAVSNPLFSLSLRHEDGTTNVLANPRIRVKNKDKAKIHIGDRVPVTTVTAAATGGFVGESVSYLDVGLKLEVEPLIHIGDEVSMKVGLEVSNIVREVPTKAGGLTYQVGTRNAATVLRLKDGETQILAGLINDEDRRTANRVPGLGELPVLGRLFSATRESRLKTEIILLITPRLLRTLDRPDNRVIEFSAGTEASTGSAPGAAGFGPIPSAPIQPQPKPVAKPEASPALPLVPGIAPQTGQPKPAAQPPMVPFGGVQPSANP
jgi:general secretion pathway protein D